METAGPMMMMIYLYTDVFTFLIHDRQSSGLMETGHAIRVHVLVSPNES